MMTQREEHLFYFVPLFIYIYCAFVCVCVYVTEERQQQQDIVAITEHVGLLHV